MKRKAAIIIFACTFGVICAALSSYYTANNLKNAHAISLANSNLYDLGYVVDALNELNQSGSSSLVILDKLETILVSSLVSLRAINPHLSTLEGTPKNTLCRIIEYNKKNGIANNGIGKYQDKELPKIAITYLSEIKPKLRELTVKSAIPLFECNKLFGIKKKYKIRPYKRIKSFAIAHSDRHKAAAVYAKRYVEK